MRGWPRRPRRALAVVDSISVGTVVIALGLCGVLGDGAQRPDSTLARPGPDGAAVECDALDLERNKPVARAVFEEILTKGKIAENERLYDPAFAARGLTRDASRAEDRAASEGWRQAFPDLTMKVLRVVAECDHVAVHWEGSGTNSGTGNGLPATGRKIRLWGMTFFRMRDGRILEEWTTFDQYSMLKQLGLLSQ